MVLNANIMSDSDSDSESDEFVTARQIKFKVKTDLERVVACIDKIEKVSNGKFEFQEMYRDMLLMQKKLEQGYKLSKKEKELLNEVEEALQDVDIYDFNKKLSVPAIRQLIREFKQARTKCGPIRLTRKLEVCDNMNGRCNFEIGDENVAYADLEVQQEECKEKLREIEHRNFKLYMFGCILLIVLLVCIAISTVWGWIVGAALTALFFYIIFWTLDNDEDE